MPKRRKKKTEVIEEVKKLGTYLRTIHGNKNR
jgi:hypothetical protein